VQKHGRVNLSVQPPTYGKSTLHQVKWRTDGGDGIGFERSLMTLQRGPAHQGIAAQGYANGQQYLTTSGPVFAAKSLQHPIDLFMIP
jgi:hypothetical protein